MGFPTNYTVLAIADQTIGRFLASLIMAGLIHTPYALARIFCVQYFRIPGVSSASRRRESAGKACALHSELGLARITFIYKEPMWSAAALTPLFQTCFFDLRMRRLAGDLALLFALESLTLRTSFSWCK